MKNLSSPFSPTHAPRGVYERGIFTDNMLDHYKPSISPLARVVFSMQSGVATQEESKNLNILLSIIQRSLKDEDKVKKSFIFKLLGGLAKAKLSVLMVLASISAATRHLISELLKERGILANGRTRSDVLSLSRISENEEVISYFFPDGGATLTDIAELTGFAASTVKIYLEELIEENIVEKRGKRKGAKFYIKEDILLILVGKKPDIVGYVDLSIPLALYQEKIVAELAKRLLKK